MGEAEASVDEDAIDVEAVRLLMASVAFFFSLKPRLESRWRWASILSAKISHLENRDTWSLGIKAFNLVNCFSALQNFSDQFGKRKQAVQFQDFWTTFFLTFSESAF